MFKASKEFFTGKKPEPVAEVPYKVEAAPVNVQAEGKVEAPPAVDPVAVALDLEPLNLSAPAEPAKKPRKPRAPKAAAEKAAKPKKSAAPKAPKKSKKA